MDEVNEPKQMVLQMGSALKKYRTWRNQSNFGDYMVSKNQKFYLSYNSEFHDGNSELYFYF